MKRYRFLPVSLLGLIGLILALPQLAAAHPLDQYLQATYITVAPKQIVVELDLSPGVLVAPQVLPLLDTNGDQQISEAEGQAYAQLVVKDVVLEVDSQPVVLSITKVDMPTFLTIQAGYGTIRVFTKGDLSNGQAGSHQLYYKNNYQPSGSAYQVNGFVDDGIPVTLGSQNRDSIQQSMTMAYTVAASSTNISPTVTIPANNAVTTTNPASAANIQTQTGPGASAQMNQLLSVLYDPTSSGWMLMLALGLAAVLGALHALTPGHGKTLVAAYLVGSRGTTRNAIVLGSVVTFTHTISVILIGLLALFASQFVVPNVLIPIMEICSGLLVILLGVRLVWTRWLSLRTGKNAHSHHHHDHEHDQAHEHQHAHSHSHDHTHEHDHAHGHTHSHVPPEGVKLSNLVALGVSGGLVPCPEALGIMIIAIGLNKILLGMGLIISFSFGLAAVLIMLGLLLVRSRSLLNRLDGLGTRWQRLLPLASAIIVTLLGAGIAYSGLIAYFG